MTALTSRIRGSDPQGLPDPGRKQERSVFPPGALSRRGKRGPLTEMPCGEKPQEKHLGRLTV